MERVKGIEPSYSAWKAAALPLSYTRLMEVLMPALAASGKMECCVSGGGVAIPKSWMAGTSPAMTVWGQNGWSVWGSLFRELVRAGQEVMKSVPGPISEQVMNDLSGPVSEQAVNDLSVSEQDMKSVFERFQIKCLIVWVIQRHHQASGPIPPQLS